MKFGKRLLGLLTHNIGWKLLSLAIALVVWGMVANEPEISAFVNVSVEYKNLPEELEISSDPVSTVKLELSGPSGELRDMDGHNQPEVILDMSKVRSGERTFAIGDNNVKLLHGVKLVRAIPSEVRFTFERSATRIVKVTPRFRERSGYAVTDFSVTPSSVTVAGPASHVSALETVLTDAVNLPAQAGTYEVPVNAYVNDSFIRFPDAARVTVTATVRKE